MKFCYTTLFRRSYKRLAQRDQERVDRALRLLAEAPHHPFHPGLAVHKLGGVTGTPSEPGKPAPQVWEMHASEAIIITFQYEEESILFRNCGQHDQVLRSP